MLVIATRFMRTALLALLGSAVIHAAEPLVSPPFAIQLRIDFYIPSSSAATLYESVDLKEAFPKGFHIAAWTVSRLSYATPIVIGSSRPIDTAKGREVNGDRKFIFNIGYKF
ncbi:MAG: hypothetical protein ABI318_09365 [Chthoniobacteraceae bacterium]